ncbi:hypothetical protein chiPu_0021426 [Chiloscyllium punctatum]|uniref:IF rod domain-containing protein n=1 Tax=Chiloscyllium punctatum TaxID=137246 RepID=A0A401REZ2_CHIPU|nr:hypothetical protein [Chiloscyllium punctatum]
MQMESMHPPLHRGTGRCEGVVVLPYSVLNAAEPMQGIFQVMGRSQELLLSQQSFERLEEEAQKREDAESNLILFRKDVDDATLTRLELERKVESLLDEIEFLKKIHNEELRDLQANMQASQLQLEMEVVKPDLTAALKEIRTQYETIATKNVQEAEEWYKSKFTDLTEAANRHNETLRQTKQDLNESRRQIQTLTCDLDALRGTQGLRRFVAQVEVLDVVPVQSFTSLSLRDYDLSSEIPSRKTVLIKTIETRDGEVINESRKERQNEPEH